MPFKSRNKTHLPLGHRKVKHLQFDLGMTLALV